MSALAVGKVDREFKERAKAVEGDVVSHILSLPSPSVQLSGGNYLSLKTTSYAGVSISSEVAGSNTSGAVRPLLLGGLGTLYQRKIWNLEARKFHFLPFGIKLSAKY